MILIFSQSYDYSTNLIVEYLLSQGRDVLRINGDDDVYKFSNLKNDSIGFINSRTGKSVNLMNASACWWRRQGITKRHLGFPWKIESETARDTLDKFLNNGRNYLEDESRDLISYLHDKIYSSINITLGKYTFNLNRLSTLDLANKCGLATPKFEVITQQSAISLSYNKQSTLVTKAISNGIYISIENNRYYTYTEVFEPQIDEGISVTHFPSLVTEYINKQIEIRSFYLAGQFYSMAIFSQTNEETKVDFRKYSNNRNEPFKLPIKIEDKLRTLFKLLDLNCGSVDLILDKAGDYVFLEINPVGQFDMTSRPCNYNLYEKVANYLMYGA